MGWYNTYGKTRTLASPDLRKIAGAALLVAALTFVLAPSAHAQNCKADSGGGSSSSSSSGGSSSGGGSGNLNCDMTYYNTKVKCRAPHKESEETVGTQPPCPKDPMPMKDTELKSFIKDYSPYLYAYARDKDNKNKAYTGTYYRGTAGDTISTFMMIGGSDEDKGGGGTPSPGGDKGKGKAKGPGEYNQFAQCIDQVKLKGGNSIEEDAKIIRLQLDNCSNQYIMQSAVGQAGNENDRQDPTLLSGEKNKSKPEERISLKTHCQPLKTKTDPEQEYSAHHYLKLAWDKVLKEPSKHDSSKPTEPYIKGLTLENPIDWPSGAKEVTLSHIAKVDYEEINDPSHPYTPRWDFKHNERDEFSPKTKEYSSDTENSVFCAGIHKGDVKQMMKVDVLAFREKPWEKEPGWINERIGFNESCYKNEGSQRNPCCLLDPITGECIEQDCWTCYGLSGKTDSESTFPPCQTGHSSNNGQDLSILPVYCLSSVCLGSATQTKYLSPCTKDNRYDEANNNIEKLCKDLRKPFTPINKLKMRYHNPKDDPDNDVLYEGVPEGLTFEEYFKDHMPYPRLWDAGQSIQKTTTTDATFQDPLDNYGQWTAIVGAGREGAPKGQQGGGSGGGSSSSSGGEEKHEDERCLYGGWGGNVSFAGVSIDVPNGITSWTELKLYQARAIRDQHLSCLPRAEKVYKPGSTEGLALLVSGANWNSTYVSCSRGPSQPYEYKTLAETEKGGPACTGGGQQKAPSYDLRSEGWTNAWRGYLSAKKEDKRFPKLGGGGGSTKSGLDNAECGDIVIMEKGATEGGKPGLAKLGYVVGLNLPNKSGCDSKEKSDCAEKKNCWVDVLEYDNGKWPDTCGITDSFGEKKTRRMWKPGMLPANVKAELETQLKWTTSCEDTRISSCEMKAWNSVKLYSIREDERDGNNGEE